MAWKYQRGVVWWIGYRHNGRQVLKSTGKSDEAEAQKELEKVEMLFGAHRANALTEELYRTLTEASLPNVTLTAEVEDWLNEAEQTTSPNTLSQYQTVADAFKAFLKANEDAPLLSAIKTADIDAYLLLKRKTSAASTVNVSRKILSVFFKRAVTAGRLRDNPASAAKTFKAKKGERVRRRPFTMEEMQLVYRTAPDDFWRYMILGGVYTGLRMGDLVCLKWGNVDIDRGFIKIEPDKTEDKLVTIPIAKPLLAMLTVLKAKAGKVKPSDHIWPEHATKHAHYKSRSGHFSNQFRDLILAPAGLATKRNHRAGQGGGKRRVSEISFHCLRHTFVSTLKSKGGSQTVAKALAGHASNTVNDQYTHVPEADLINAINLLPEFTA